MRISDWSSDVCSSDLHADGDDVGAGQARGLQVRLQAGLQVGNRVVRQPAHVGAAGFVAQHQRIGLRAVQQAQRDAGIGRMEQRALSFDEVPARSEEHTSELQSLMRISYAVFCLKKTKNKYST